LLCCCGTGTNSFYFVVGAGVGSLEANALTSALIWVARDGIGMIGSLVLAYYCADGFEVNVKEWRLFADFLNNFALTLDLLAGWTSPLCYFWIVAVSTLAKSCCWLIAGATKARISAHFALPGHLADVTAKESTQETGIALLGILLGMICAHAMDDKAAVTWAVFVGLLILHQWANYRLIRVLILDTLNPQRIQLITHCAPLSPVSPVDRRTLSRSLCPSAIASQETLWRPVYLWFYGPRVGVSLERILRGIAECPRDNNVDVWTNIVDMWKDEPFIIGYDVTGHLTICLSDICDTKNIMRAHFIGCYIQRVNEHKPHLSPQKLYKELIETQGRQAQEWFKKCIAPIVLNNSKYNEWNTTADASRLIVGSWRYSFNNKTL
jgi:hypothetical protein